MNEKYQELLNFIDQNQNKIVFEPTEYANQLQLAFSYKFYPYPIDPVLFPKMRLHVERLSDEFIDQHFLILYKLAQLLNNKDEDNTFNAIWFTTSFVETSGLLLVMISFE